MITWLKGLLPKKIKDDPTVAEITRGITLETAKLETAIVKLDNEVISMQKERVAMNDMLDQALEIIALKRIK